MSRTCTSLTPTIRPVGPEPHGSHGVARSVSNDNVRWLNYAYTDTAQHCFGCFDHVDLDGGAVDMRQICEVLRFNQVAQTGSDRKAVIIYDILDAARSVAGTVMFGTSHLSTPVVLLGRGTDIIDPFESVVVWPVNGLYRTLDLLSAREHQLANFIRAVCRMQIPPH